MGKHRARCPKCGHKLAYDSATGDQVTCSSCGASLRVPGKATPSQPADPLIGQSLGEFEILELLGRGGMGAVYKARQPSLDRMVAIKVLPQRLASNESFVERFNREARAAAAINHPNIIEVYAVGQGKGHQFIAMEFIDGETLADTLKREGRLAPDRALDVMKHVAAALAAAHECGILHRDIKPSNILINRRGHVKVADFGLAKHEGVDVSVTATGAALGTPLYMPPESAQGEPLDARGDLYSLGATFYQALAGKPPFDGTTPAELAVKHVTTQVPPLQQIAPDVPPALCRVIHRLLRKSPAERYESADKLLEALARVEARLVGGTSPSRVGSVGGTSPSRAGSVGGVSVPRVPAAATHTLPPDARRKRTTTRRREAVGGASLPRVPPRWVWISTGIAALLVLVVVLVLGRNGERPKGSVPPPPPKPGTRHPEPAPDAARLERGAAIVFKNIQTCIDKKDWQKAKSYLARLQAKYGKTRFVAAHEADISALQQQIAAALKPSPKLPPPKPEAPKPQSLPDDDERWTAWEDLFDGKTLKGWRLYRTGENYAKPGRVYAQEGKLVLERGGPATAIAWTGDCPRVDYEIAIDVMPMAPPSKLSFAVYFPLGASTRALGLVGTPSSIVIVGLSSGDGRPGGYENETKKPMAFESGRWYRMRLRVTKARIQTWIDGRKMIDLVTAGHTFGAEGPAGAPELPLRVATRQAAAVRNIRLRRLKPEPPPDDDARWTEWEDLFDGKTLNGWRVVGRFPVEPKHGSGKGGNVHVENGQIVLEPGQPRTGIASTGGVPMVDYEVAMDAMRLAGEATFCGIVFPVGGSHCHLAVYHNGVELGRVDGGCVNNEMGFLSEERRWYRVRLRVTGPRIEAWIDRQKAIDLPTAGHTFAIQAERQPLKPFGVCSWKTKAALRNIRLRQLKEYIQSKDGPWRIYLKWPFDAAEAKGRQSETAKALGVPVEQDIALGNGVKMTLVLIPAGEFLMGSPPTTSPEQLQKLFGGERKWYHREFPQHRVTITKPFWLGKTEVTQAQWQAVMGNNPSKFAGKPQNPVEQVSWHDCQGFLQKLSAKSGKTSRLPTEAEWEHACRAGSASDFYFGDSANRLSGYAWVNANSGGSTHPVGETKPNAWGLHDVHGNVWEWCQDWHGPYEKAPQVDPKGPGAGRARVTRGGSWWNVPGMCRSASRSVDPRASRGACRGFRVCAVAVPPTVGRQEPTRRPEARTERPPARALEAKFQGILKPAEGRVKAWDFAGAVAALGKHVGGVSVPRELAQRVARRREEAGRMAALKAKMIERVNTAKPRLRKSSIFLKGMNADLVKADEKGITTAKLPTGKTETFAWQDLSARSAVQLARLSIDTKSADDLLAAGLLALLLDDAKGAERFFASAQKNGAAIGRYLDPLAAASFARAKALLQEARGVGTPGLQEGRGVGTPGLQEGRGAETPRPHAERMAGAVSLLGELQAKYGKTSWFAAHKEEVEAARQQAKAGIAEAEAEKLYARAAVLFKKQDLWALKPVTDTLKADYPKARLMTDAARKPTFADMAAAVAKLGKFLTVRKDGKGDFKSIQAAIDAAPPNSLIEIQDNGPYYEGLLIPADKEGITVRGKRARLPLIASKWPDRPFNQLVRVRAPRATLHRVAIVHTAGDRRNTRDPCALAVTGRGVRMRAVFVHAGAEGGVTVTLRGTACYAEDCVFLIRGDGPFLLGGSDRAPIALRNCFATGGRLQTVVSASVEVRSCTIAGRLELVGRPNLVVDSIVGNIGSRMREYTIEHCNVFWQHAVRDVAKPGKACFKLDPQFRDPKNLDYRLKRTSPCRGRASDGGDIGCRYTPEMLEMLKLAFELRKKGIIKF